MPETTKLYRYRSMASKGLSRTFTHDELYFASPLDFNDPFDCCPPFSTTEYTDDDLREHFRKAYSTSKLDAKAENIEKKVISIKNNNSFKSSIVQPFLETCREVNSSLGILCLSKKPDDILMWSHYADGHRGIVLEFNKPALEKNFYCDKVDYDNNIITLKDHNEKSSELHKLILLKKSEHWKDEEEWRLIVDPSSRTDIPNCRIFKFPKEALTGVILGYNMIPEDEYFVREWLKESNHPAKVYKAERNIDAYSIKIPGLSLQND